MILNMSCEKLNLSIVIKGKDYSFWGKMTNIFSKYCKLYVDTFRHTFEILQYPAIQS